MNAPSATQAAPLRILFINHVGAFGGATKSLVEMLAALPAGAVQGVAITPPGPAADALLAAGLRIITARGVPQWDNTRFGHYRGLRWLILLRELSYWPPTLRALKAGAAAGPFDLIHCNEVTALLPALRAKRLLRVPLVVHVRSLQRGAEGGRLSAWLNGLLRRHADAVIAIDEAVYRTLPAGLPVDVIHNGLRAPTELPSPQPDEAPFRVSIIGTLHRSKGVYECVAAARLLKDRGVNVQIVFAGDNVRSISGLRGWLLRKFNFSRDVRAELETCVAEQQLGERVRFLGFVSDVQSLYARTDALCFPSHLDAPGRPVFEAALYGLPSIVAMRNPTADVFEGGRTGVCISHPTPEAIADAIQSLAEDRPRARAMGEQARLLALGRFESRHTASKTLAVYRRLMRPATQSLMQA